MSDPTPDDDIRAALRAAATDVQPALGLEEIQERLDERPRSRGVVIGTIAAMVATVLVIGGVSWLNHEAKKPKPAPSTGRDATVVAYFLGATAHGDRLYSELHSLHDVRSSDLQAAVNTALGSPDDPDYKPFPGVNDASVTADGDLVTIDFANGQIAAHPALSDAEAEAALQALVWTVNDALHRPVQVRFEVNGKPAATLFDRPVKGAVGEGDPDSVLAPVSVDIAEGAQIQSGTPVLGRAATVEGTVVWELRQGELVVMHGFTTVGQCCTLSPFAFQLTAPPGSYTLVVHDTDESDNEGSGVDTDSKDIVITRGHAD